MRFGQYELLERVAVGGMAEVFRGRAVGAEGFEKWIAIKRVLPDLARDEAIVAMLLSEARIHAALSHRNIVQIHDLGVSEDGEYFIVLEYVEGRRVDMLGDWVATGKVSGRAIVATVMEMYIQMMLVDGLFHADPHPGNLMVTPDGKLVLLDFGMAGRVPR